MAMLLCKHRGLEVGKQRAVVRMVWGKGWDLSWWDGGSEQRALHCAGQVPAPLALPDLSLAGRRLGTAGGFTWRPAGSTCLLPSPVVALAVGFPRDPQWA